MKLAPFTGRPTPSFACRLPRVVSFSLSSVVDPMRRLWTNPMARPIIVSRKNYARGLTRRFSS